MRARAFGLVLAICGFAIPRLSAEITRIEIVSAKPWLDGHPVGKAGAYEKLQGRIYFAVDPESPSSRHIADVSLAPRNAQGRVEFSSDFVVLRPRDPSLARHSVFLEIPNRGHTQSNRMFFSTAPGSGFDILNLDANGLNDAFLFEQGFTVAWIGWQFDLGPDLIRLDARAANVNSVVRDSIIVNAPGLRAARLGGSNSYCASDAAQPNARLIVRNRFNDRGRTIARADWAFARLTSDGEQPDPCGIVYKHGFEPGQIYEVVYQGAHPPVAGLGEAAVRDFVSWLKFGGTSSTAGSPLREHPETLARVIAYGYSQSGRFLRDFLYHGFNADERGRQVFDGMFVASAGGGRGSFDHRYAMPGEAGNSVLADLRPADLFPFTDSVEPDPATGARDGLLASAEASHTVPKIFYTFSSTEYWARAGSLTYTSVDGARELPFSPNSRLYFFPGTPHSHGPFPPSRQRGAYSNFSNFASSGWSFRALLLDLDDWIAKATTPPGSAYPHLGRELVSREHVTFPSIPGVEFPAWMPRNWRMDFGPEFPAKGIISIEPPKLGDAYRILVPQVNRDGIDLGGVRIPEIAVPLGTFTGWNYQLPVHPNLDYLGGLIGSFIPFPATAADRKKSQDSRASIAERYSSREDFLTKIRAAAQNLAAQRFLRTDDIPEIVAENARYWDALATGR